LLGLTRVISGGKWPVGVVTGIQTTKKVEVVEIHGPL